MASPLFNQYGNQGMSGLLQRFNQFKAQFQGDPKAEVERLMRTGRMSQEQLNQLQRQASQIMQLFR